MPEKTDAEWQSLSNRIAREVMGWVVKYYPETWTSKARAAYFVPEAIPTFQVYVDLWQPHKNVVQAMVALHAVLTKTGRHITADLVIRPPPGCCRLIIHDWSRDEEILGERMGDEKYAICSAIEKFMEANC